ncbi:Phosphatidylinositol 4-kinase stt4 [Cytospora mali]|uniref:1-phosphatidylinositol 4-kinase n=1 Tax=Cytospora mali TaxID=578113 RepID=A0A194UQY0_CYTMA|nr:Phosphatidylinositol 4-kinase stt4 [Valsa mali var. pyri (nom. inval.)]
MARDIRSKALERIAALSASKSTALFEKSDLDRLCKACPSHANGKSVANGTDANRPLSLGRVPMTIREYDVLLSLCKAAPLVQNSQNAQRLTRQLAPYLLDAHTQEFVPSPFYRKIEPSPTESLSYHVTFALLCLGNHDGEIYDSVAANVSAFLNACAHAMESVAPGQGQVDNEATLQDAIHTATIAVSLLGFLDAAAAQADFWRSGSRLALVQTLQRLLSEKFLVVVETAFSTIRNSHSHDRAAREWRRYLRHYLDIGRPLGAMLLQQGFMTLVAASTSMLVAETIALKKNHVLDLLMSGDGLLRPGTARSGNGDMSSVVTYANIVVDQLNYLDASADFIRMGSTAQQKIACRVKAAAFISYLNCSRLNGDAADAETLMAWLEETLVDPDQMADENLASVVLRSTAVVCKMSPTYGATVSRLLPRYIVQGRAPSHVVVTASQCLAYVLRMLSTDAVITTLYALGNVLSPTTEQNGKSELGLETGDSQIYGRRQSTGSSISLQITGEEETFTVYANVIDAICGIATACNDEKISALAQSILLQKYDKISNIVDARVINGAAVLALSGGQLEFRSLLKTYARISHAAVVENRTMILDALVTARNHISANLRPDSQLYEIYWDHMLDSIVSKGDVQQTSHAKESDMELAAKEIAQLLQPLAVFMSANDMATNDWTDDESHAMLRDAWFNIVVHGFNPSTERGKKYATDLQLIAIHSPPLVAEQRGEQVESDIELNTVLRRGMSAERETIQKKQLAELVPSKASEVKSLTYRKVIFLHAAYLVESLRAESGDCTKVLSYFLEPSMRRGDVSSIMEGITGVVVEIYLRKTLEGSNTFSAQYAASQLATIFCNCCHRIERVQQAAYACADRIIRDVPSALCRRSSLFALLELLSLMWASCLEAETDLYEPRTTFSSTRGNVMVELSDDYAFRRLTLNRLHKAAKGWVQTAINLAPADVKGLLQTYLSEFDDEGAYGHISLGRSFAMELGSSIPATDRLVSVDKVGEATINTASDFIAQYTTRQEYRYAEALPDHSLEWLAFMRIDRRASYLTGSENESADAVTALAHIEDRILQKKNTPMADIRDILRRAAAMLCRSESGEECAVAHYLVSIPFALFTKQSIKLGVSLWLGVINENPIWEPRILNEIVQQWEFSIHKKLGLFNTAITHPDPFFLKEEFAPSDQEALTKRKHLVHNLLSPHVRLLEFLGSHFNATRLGSPDTQKVLVRLLDITMEELKKATPHPLAREIRLQAVLFGLRVLRTSTRIGPVSQWRLKDKLLSAALSWFCNAPKWSFGSNMLQLKTEIRLITDVIYAIKAVGFIGAHSVGTFRSLQALQSKEQLLLLLLENEQSRLTVWVYPLSEPAQRPSTLVHSGKGSLENAIIPLIRTAWIENASLAIELCTRFQSPRIHKEIRSLLLNCPEKAVSEPEALPILLGGSLPTDVTFQLKYLLFWAPVNPITAVAYFLPVYQNHTFLIQYAMRALESHSVDVTFFYVPQIVQTLRYDALGYAERYIVETAQFSQLFAHQIIWNMKANSYKDDDGQVPDEIKPKLDKVMERMLESFDDTDREFYEREFTFFDEVTGISGKLKPLIKKSKPEKAQKIEEELRNIKVEVGVYLPSNPDGVVVGIDRKSGKPLQSHAKAPFMATFRIKKERGDLEETGDMLEETVERGVIPAEKDNSYEVWQSAIFKVGDDCRQDVLALQMIAAFRGIFHSVGLDVYVFPYRVTATAPGCGVIDVLPNSVSRDMLGREAVNGLYDYFVSKYGNEDSLRYQQARNNFVKSMAAYSLISFLLQFKDRHNGNIMIDDAGHILHIDFGFCFDIAPGGIKFERAPFKLTSEMVAVMGGSTNHQSFKWFEELSVKAFLASRMHVEKLSQIVLLMMDSGLPCFKPESVEHFKQRFVLEKTEREAADFMKELIRKSYSSYSTGIYDQFQLMTNGIPY